MDPAEWRDFDFREGTGCMECGGTGYHVAEPLSTSCSTSLDTVREIVLAKKPTSEISQAVRKRKA